MSESKSAAALLVGTWRLRSHRQQTVETGETFSPRGERPSGLLTYTADGRFSVLNVPGDRKLPASVKPTSEEALALFDGLTAYAGRYTIVGDKVVHHVEVSWNQLWTGTDQVRGFAVAGDALTIVAGPDPSPIDGKLSVSTLSWDRVR
ncbi:lipocalin-like domain-containing protein [Arenibaculum sp.]|uniref:lipocalin-like domain-containing protein n=1 Tax=Arenibaculum sp. TaxID=2865862 RepID=UPI002E100209|nr:lipocalin-like domain-containing protein [Arenibaculum sp.]